MPGARPTPQRPAVGAPVGRRPRSAAPLSPRWPSRPGDSLRSLRSARPLVRRAAGLVLGLAVLIPVATALGDGQDGHPGGPPSVAAGIAER